MAPCFYVLGIPILTHSSVGPEVTAVQDGPSSWTFFANILENLRTICSVSLRINSASIQ